MGMNKNEKPLAVFDIGGTSVKYGLFAEEGLHEQGKFNTPATMEEMQAEMSAVIQRFSRPVVGVAISAPGAVNSAKRRIDGLSAVPYLHHRPIFDELEAHFNLPVTIENDANCAGICEMARGAGKNFQHAAFIVLGTGVGGAIFIHRQLYKGAHLFGGEFGFMKCTDEKTLSLSATGVKMAQAYSERTGTEVDGQQLFELADTGDPLACQLLDEMYQRITNALYNLQVSLDLEAFILGGGISARKEIATELSTRLNALLEKEEIPDIAPKICTCEYQNDANLFGAAVHFFNEQ